VLYIGNTRARARARRAGAAQEAARGLRLGVKVQ